MWFYWLSPYRIMFFMPSPFGVMGPNSLLCLEVSEVLEVPSSNSLRRQKSRRNWTLTETCRASMAVFLKQTVELRVEFFPGWSLSWNKVPLLHCAQCISVFSGSHHLCPCASSNDELMLVPEGTNTGLFRLPTHTCLTPVRVVLLRSFISSPKGPAER